MGLYSQWCP